MKKFTFLLLVLAGTLSLASAQTKPAAGTISLGFRFTGLDNIGFNEWDSDVFEVPQVMGRYYLTDRLALRGRLGIQSGNVTENFGDTYVDTLRFSFPVRVDSATELTTSSFNLSFTPGVEFHLAPQAAKLDPYVGAEIPFSFVGSTNTEFINDFRYTDLGGILIYDEDINTKREEEGGIAVGLNLLGGFNFFLTDHIAVGAEYSIGFLFTQVGGDIRQSSTGVIQPSANSSEQIPVDETVIFNASTTSTTINTASTGGVNVSIFW
ncbi:MAG: outer membrane beta-barrel protein [Bacteroidota bacterium]